MHSPLSGLIPLPPLTFSSVTFHVWVCLRRERFLLNNRKKTWAKLTRPQLRGGNIALALCSVADLLKKADLKPACDILYGPWLTLRDYDSGTFDGPSLP